jgi:hypothetical protein
VRDQLWRRDPSIGINFLPGMTQRIRRLPTTALSRPA